jgi:hypothetical protein
MAKQRNDAPPVASRLSPLKGTNYVIFSETSLDC